MIADATRAAGVTATGIMGNPCLSADKILDLVYFCPGITP
jgi:hypothetical protein